MNQYPTKEALKKQNENPTKQQGSPNQRQHEKAHTATRAWVIERVSKKLEVLEGDVKLIFEETLKTIIEELQEGNDVIFKGFGSFTVVKTNPKPSPYVKGGITQPRKKIKFKPSKTIEL